MLQQAVVYHLIGIEIRPVEEDFIELSPARHASCDEHVPDELLDRPSVMLNRCADRIEVAVEHLAQELSVQALTELGRADQVAEEGCDQTATDFTWRDEPGPTLSAELLLERVLVTAGETGVRPRSSPFDGVPRQESWPAGRRSSSPRL